MTKPAPLNEAQQQAVEHATGPLLVLAGAGSGKTKVITEKIAWLIETDRLQANQIAAVTFTNRAAREMQGRLAERLSNKSQRHGVTTCTFHSLGLQIVRQDCRLLNLRPGFSIFDAADTLQLLRELKRQQGWEQEGELEAYKNQISSWKGQLIDPTMAVSKAKDEDELAAAQAFVAYAEALQAYNAVDFDDLIYRSAQLLTKEETARTYWQNKFRYLMVDEYQDTNSAQYQLLRLLAGDRARFTVVGDDDQSIYAWRGANPENLRQLGRDYPNLKVIKLEQNYRCSARILRAANTLIANNEHIYDKKLWSAGAEGPRIEVWPCNSPDHEADKTVLDLVKQRFEFRDSHANYAILYRSNHQARLFEAKLREHRIPYKLTGGTAFFDRAEVKDLVAYLRLRVNPTDDAAFLRVINTPRREIGPATLQKLGLYAQARCTNLLPACTEMGLSTAMNDAAREKLQRFSEWFYSIDTSNAVECCEKLLADLNYRQWLVESSKNEIQANKRWDFVQEFVEWIGNIGKRLKENGDDNDLMAVLNRMSLLDMLDRQNEEEEDDAVRLMTLHAAKGLEFRQVYLVGCEEEVLPHRNCLHDDDALSEERRLTYVGITRAKQRLVLSYARKRRKAGEIVTCDPSRFLSELPEDDLKWLGKGPAVSNDERIATGKAQLASLRNMLE